MLILYAILIFSYNNDKATTVSPDSLILFLLHPTFHLPAGYILLFYNALLSLLLETSLAGCSCTVLPRGNRSSSLVPILTHCKVCN